MSSIQEALSLSIKKWGIESTPIFKRKVKNWVYYIEDKKAYLRITEKSHRSRSQIDGELHWMKFLQKNGINLASPIKSIDGEYIVVANGAKKYFLCLFEEASGSLRKSIDEYSKNDFLIWGQTTGKLHSLTKEYSPADMNSRFDWKTDPFFLEMIENKLLGNEKIQEYLSDILIKLKVKTQTNDSYGMIHGDLYHSNFHFKEDEMMLFDFDDCHYNWFSFEIGDIFHGLSVEKISFEMEEVQEIFLNGYLQYNQICARELSVISLFKDYRRIMLYYWGLKREKDSKYSPESRKWLSEQGRKTEEYFSQKDF